MIKIGITRTVLIQTLLMFVAVTTLTPVGVGALTISSPVSGANVSSGNLAVSGTATANSTVLVSQNGITLNSTIADSSGSWSVAVSVTGSSATIKATEIPSSYGYFGTAGQSNAINRVLSGGITLNPGGGVWPLVTTDAYLLPTVARPQATSIYLGVIGDSNDIPGKLELTAPAEPSDIISYPASPVAGSGVFNQSGTKLYIPNNALSTISVVNYATNTVTGDISMPAGYMPGVNMAQNGYIYAPTDDTVHVIDPATDTIIKSFDVGCPTSAFGLGYASFPRGRDYYYMTCANDGLIKKYRTSDDTLLTSFDISVNHLGISSLQESLDGKKLYVGGIYSSATGNKITVIDAIDGSLLSTITLTADTFSGAMSPDGQYIYVSTQGPFDGSIMNIDIISTTTDTIVSQIDTSSLGIPGVLTWVPGQEVDAEVIITVADGGSATLASTGSSSLIYTVAALSTVIASCFILAKMKNTNKY